MFTFLSCLRRQTAVLTALALVASVLVAVPVLAADDPPKADYLATFSACVGDAAEDADFEDVPDGHTNAGDIDCIAYYGVTKGTSATTYSPLMSVTREHMALFLTRLAKLVGIEMVSDPDDAGFTDIGELSEESQTAINQLADLGITQGTSATTYSPADTVPRAHMALFIARLMDKMSPIADGEIGLSSTTQHGYLPSDVDDNDKDAEILSPFGESIRSTTKEEWDAITRLWELGVASGITDTSYAPEQDITRAAMAGFMAGVLDHSNARPTGLNLAASASVVWGPAEPTVLASFRDSDFMPVEDQAVDLFSSAAGDDALRDDGTCNFDTEPDEVNFGDLIDGDCVWNDNDDATDVSGNLFTPQEVNEGKTRVFYVWIGQKDGDKFDTDDVADEHMGSVSVTAKHDQHAIKVTSTINKRADNKYTERDNAETADVETEGPKVDLGVTRTVTFTAQLVDENGSAVERAGVKISVRYDQGSNGDSPYTYTKTSEVTYVTDENGQVSYMVTGPSDDPKKDDQTRSDDITFMSKDLTDVEKEVYWVEDDPVLTTDSLGKPDYLLARTSGGSVSVTVYLYDQYGNPHRSHREQRVKITIDDDGTTGDNVAVDELRGVISRGYARWNRTEAELVANRPVEVTYDVRQLARNSKGDPVQSTDTPAAFIALTATAVDALPITYNDGEVIVTERDSTTVEHGLTYDHDNNDETTSLSGPLSKPTGNQKRRNILSSSALDLYDTRATAVTNDTNDTSQVVQVVEKANSQNLAKAVVYAILADDNEFLTDANTAAAGNPVAGDGNADLVYSYDSDDIFIDRTGDDGTKISMDRFEVLLGRDIEEIARKAVVEVIAYNVDGTSIFRVNTKAAE